MREPISNETPAAFRKIPNRSGGAGIPFPQTPFPSRPALAWFHQKIFCERAAE